MPRPPQPDHCGILPQRTFVRKACRSRRRKLSLSRNVALDLEVVAEHLAALVGPAAQLGSPDAAGGDGLRDAPDHRGDEAHVVDAWSVVRDEANVGASVVIADWRCDWIGLGVAEKLARAGCRVRLVVNGAVPGEGIHFITRDMWIGALHKLGVEMTPFARLYGVDSSSAFFQHTVSGEALVLDEVDTLVTVQANRRNETLAETLQAAETEVHLIGDCLSPRTAEEAVLDALKVAAVV